MRRLPVRGDREPGHVDCDRQICVPGGWLHSEQLDTESAGAVDSAHRLAVECGARTKEWKLEVPELCRTPVGLLDFDFRYPDRNANTDCHYSN